MKWFGYPVEIMEAMIDGQMKEVAVTYQWADGTRRTGWRTPRKLVDQSTIKRIALPAPL